jgi:hypothetical protein
MVQPQTNSRQHTRSTVMHRFVQQFAVQRFSVRPPATMRNLYIAVAVLLVAFALHACSTASTTTTANKVKRPGADFAIEPVLERRANLLTSLRADGNLTVEVNGKAQKAQFVGSLYKKDSLVLTVLGPFNILVAKIGSTIDFMNYYDALTNTVYQGAPSPKNFQQRLGVPLSHTDIASFLRGEIPGGFTGFLPEAIVTNDSEQVYTRQRDTITERVTYSFVENTLTTYKRSGKLSGAIIDAQYSNFTTSDNVRLPQEAMVLFPQAKAMFSVQCRAVEANPKDQKYTFIPPLEAKRRKF